MARKPVVRPKFTDQRSRRKERESYGATPSNLRPLPAFCHEPFEALIDDYERYVDNQIRTYILAVNIVENYYTANMLTHWKAVKKQLKHIRWVGTRKND